MSSNGRLYKICQKETWEAASEKGVFTGSGIDHRDRYIHLSARYQVAETLRRHFAGANGLVLLEIAQEQLRPQTLKWETARRGELFPHLYASLPLKAVECVYPIPDSQRDDFVERLP